MTVYHTQKWHEKFTIARRMTGISILLLISLIMVGLIHELSLSNLENVDKKKKHMSELVEQLNVLTEHSNWQFADVLLLMEKNKGLPKEYHHTVAENIESYDSLLKNLPQRFHDQATKLKQTQITFNDLILDYSKQKELMGLSAKEGLRGKLKKAVHELETQIKKSGNDKKLVSMLMMRRHEKDFMLQGLEEYLDKHAREASRFVKILDASSMNRAEGKLVLALLQNYTDNFKSYAKASLTLKQTHDAFEHRFTSEILPGLDKLNESLSTELEILALKAESIHSSASIYFWGIVLLILLFVMTLLRFITQSITKPLGDICDAMDALDDGDTSVDLDIKMEGNIGKLTKSYDKLRKTSRESFLLQRTVEASPQATMIANASDLKVTYMNAAAFELFKSIEDFLPCKAERIVGQCIDIFHKHPGHQRKILSSKDNLPLKANFIASGKHIEFEANAIDDNEGNWQAIMVSWKDASERAALANDFEEKVSTAVSEIMSFGKQVQEASLKLSAMAEKSSNQANTVSGSAHEASSNVDSVATASEQLSASISEIDRQAAEAVKVSSNAVSESENSIETVKSLSDASVEVGEVVRLIGDIAGQTNLLALNASIEAARAGEAGRGFAVVASEVKALANQTASEADHIAQQIGDIQNKSSNVAGSISRISDVISKMNDINYAIASATEQQNLATQEISNSVQHASNATSTASHEIEGVTESSSETGKAATELLEVSNALSKKGEYLSQRVNEFLSELRG